MVRYWVKMLKYQVSYRTNKISLYYEDDENISINCTNSFIYGYLSENNADAGVVRNLQVKNGDYDGKEYT